MREGAAEIAAESEIGDWAGVLGPASGLILPDFVPGEEQQDRS